MNEIASEILKVAKELTAENITPAESQLREAIRILSYSPIEYTAGRKAKQMVNQALAILEEVLEMCPTPVKFNVYGLDKDMSFNSEEELVRALAAKGIRQTGTNGFSTQLRKELNNRPTFKELAGPMYDGPKAIRYETWETNRILSQ